MKKVVIVDARETFLTDMGTRILIEENSKIHFDVVGYVSSVNDISKIIGNRNPDLMIVSENMLKQQDDWQYGIPIIVYAQTESGIEMAKAKKLHTYGIISSTSELINAINTNKILTYTENQPQDERRQVKTPEKKQKEQTRIPASPVQDDSRTIPQKNNSKIEVSDSGDTGLPVLDDDFGFFTDEPIQPRHQESARPAYLDQTPQSHYPYDEYEETRLYEEPDDFEEKNRVSDSSLMKEIADEAYSSANEVYNPSNRENRRMDYAKPEQSKEMIEQRIDRDLQRRKRGQDTKVVSFYAAKGGVGKTTLSTNVATYLSLMGTERKKNRVCIVDFNIDFGDVLTTLYLDSEGANMLHWADDIDDKFRSGKKKDDISYSRAEIESYLQKMKDCELYALVAPVNHTDSMSLTEAQLEVMIHNLIVNGDFDYIICDTGNNTRDSTVIALDNSDMIFLVVTQDVTTANCNASFLETFDRIGFDLNKIRLVVNNILPYKETGISVKDLEDNFPDYPCIARINHYPAVIRANNLGKPLTLNPTHEYTKELRGIVQYITGVVPEKEEKVSFFSKLFGKKRK